MFSLLFRVRKGALSVMARRQPILHSHHKSSSATFCTRNVWKFVMVLARASSEGSKEALGPRTIRSGLAFMSVSYSLKSGQAAELWLDEVAEAFRHLLPSCHSRHQATQAVGCQADTPLRSDPPGLTVRLAARSCAKRSRGSGCLAALGILQAESLKLQSAKLAPYPRDPDKCQSRRCRRPPAKRQRRGAES